ncbi:TPA: hypothetical protein U3R49_001982 [Streptococcus agalactiae]|uniref:hypothetical protein n=1 Tax=Streptococcus agalactiae TaxID=1311 RepID=UPI000B49B013|nr:hypothetical protein [Streptococcus agalactiae]ASA93094.1 hypothetical protein BB159_10130 [Streptococcus agalactiae]AWZ34346.1 hypothetical protein CDH81_06050 [Streptococcus agalactiae]KAF0051270.1 hypothetical protein GL192_08020 [Streptococcus agalactiae]MCC9769547.1 hypothetical protein [Streptococcus agalactiae]MCC9774874.1 hypothetical protein [Streptococcus agalactiae]
MKKKFLSLLLLAFSALALVACKNNSLDGEYYWINDARNQHMATIKGDKGYVESEGGYSIKIDSELKIIESKFGSEKYSYKDGKLTTNFTGVESDFYKKGSKACEEALKKYGYKEVGKE